MVLKIIKHCGENLPELVTGQLLGLDVSRTLEVSNCLPFPQKDAEDDTAAEYYLEMMRHLR